MATMTSELHRWLARLRRPLRSQGLITISHWTDPMQANISSRGQTNNI